ncbi:hypothetical protein APSETT444_003198 [Aspergillus pseudonomiae]
MPNIQEKPETSEKDVEVALSQATDLHRVSVGYGEQLPDPSTSTTNTSLLRKIDWRLSQSAIMGIVEDLVSPMAEDKEVQANCGA